MSVRRDLLLVAMLGFPTLSPLAAHDKLDKASGQDREAVVAYLKAFEAEDVDIAVKASDMPFVMNDRGAVETEEGLRQEFPSPFDNHKKVSGTFSERIVRKGSRHTLQKNPGEPGA